jgi:hypothetical protein
MCALPARAWCASASLRPLSCASPERAERRRGWTECEISRARRAAVAGEGQRWGCPVQIDKKDGVGSRLRKGGCRTEGITASVHRSSRPEVGCIAGRGSADWMGSLAGGHISGAMSQAPWAWTGREEPGTGTRGYDPRHNTPIQRTARSLLQALPAQVSAPATFHRARSPITCTSPACLLAPGVLVRRSTASPPFHSPSPRSPPAHLPTCSAPGTEASCIACQCFISKNHMYIRKSL